MKTLDGSNFLNVRVELTPREFKWLSYALASSDELRKEDAPFLGYLESNLDRACAGLPTITDEEFTPKNQESLAKSVEHYEELIRDYKSNNADEIVKTLEKKVNQLKAWQT